MSVDEQGYNGWKNYETWAVGMFLDGNYDGAGTYYETIERVRSADPTEESCRRGLVAGILRDFVETATDPCGYGDDDATEMHPLVSDLLNASLSEVDWYELAEAWIENVSEQVA